MTRLTLGFIAGFVVATVGINGITSLLDSTVQQAQTTLKESVK